jgi:hypothetical protein
MPIPQVNDRIKEAPVVVLRAVFAGIGQILLTADKVRARATEQVWTPDRAPERTPAGLPADRRTPEPPRNGTTRTEPAVAGQTAAREAPASHPPATKSAPAAKTAPATKSAPAAETTPVAKAAPAAKNRPVAKAAPAAKTTAAAKTAPATKASRPAATPSTAKTPSTATTRPARAAPEAKAPKTVPAPRAANPEPAAEAPPLPGYDDLSLASLRARLRVLDAPTIQAMLAYERAHARREPVITMLERRLAKISAG